MELYINAFLKEQETIFEDNRLININLSELDLGELQNNQFCEHRLFLTDIVNSSKGDYVGFLTWRWSEKFATLPPFGEILKMQIGKDEVYVAWKEDDWTNITIKSHHGMEKYLYELSGYTKLPLFKPNGFWSN